MESVKKLFIPWVYKKNHIALQTHIGSEGQIKVSISTCLRFKKNINNKWKCSTRAFPKECGNIYRQHTKEPLKNKWLNFSPKGGANIILSPFKFINKKFGEYKTLVMFEHTIFSLAFGIVAMSLAANGLPPIKLLILILIALLSARTGANAINRVIDAKIDKINPRTATRQLPMGLLTKKESLIFAFICFGIMIVAAFFINPLAFWLSPIALFFMVTYSYTKRFTWCCHIYLGITCAMAPVGAWIAVVGNFFAIEPFLLGVINTTWVAGLDIIYGNLDYEFDISNNIHSIPARFGIKKALLIALLMHFTTFIFMIILGIASNNLNLIYFVGVFIIGALLIYQHKIISPSNLSLAKVSAYNVNQIISIIFLVCGLLAIFL